MLSGMAQPSIALVLFGRFVTWGLIVACWIAWLLFALLFIGGPA